MISPKADQTNDDTNYLTDMSGEKADQHSRLFLKFRHKQLELRNKFKKFIQVQGNKFPRTRDEIKNNIVPQLDDLSIANVRKIRQQKQQLIEEMNQTLNQGRYLQHRKSEQIKTFFLIKNKYRRVETLRSERKAQVKELQKSWKFIKDQIRQQKLKFRKSIDESRLNLVKSKIQNEQKKYVLAEKERHMKQLYKHSISQEQAIQFKHKRTQCESVRKSQKLVSINVSRVIEEKQKKADDLKLQRIFRQFAEKQQVKIVSARIKEKSKRYGEIRRDTSVLEAKIQQFRKGLGERRLSPDYEFECIHPISKHSFTQSHKDFSTKSGFHKRPMHQSFTDQIKYE